jgi:hypothetical protein
MQQAITFSFPPQPRVGLLIDAENARASQMPQVMAYANTLGRVTQRRAYGEWTGPQLQPWRKVLETHAIRPRQQFRHARNKNASDMVLIMDAMEAGYPAGAIARILRQGSVAPQPALTPQRSRRPS